MLIYVKYDIIYGYGESIDIDADNNIIIVSLGENKISYEYSNTIGKIYEVDVIEDFQIGKYKYIDGIVSVNPDYEGD